jgi:hypothetical protein
MDNYYRVDETQKEYEIRCEDDRRLAELGVEGYVDWSMYDEIMQAQNEG